MALQYLGVGAILAQSFGRIFYRNALNFGIPAIIFPAATEISPGDELQIDPVSGDIENRSTGKVYSVNGLPGHLMTMVEAGGLMPYLKTRIGNNKPGAL
jgi:3-isopropylmalate/(R)-2-methylmalate dehydratase small subunit